MNKLPSSGHTVVIWDDDTPETITQKVESAQYIIDMRTDITIPLEYIIKQYKSSIEPEPEPEKKNKEPKYKFNIGE